jgi:sulfoxide reductase heme-binding subunit YedZ
MKIFTTQLIFGIVSGILIYAFPFLQGKYRAGDIDKASIFGWSLASYFWILLAVCIGPLHVISKGFLPNSFWKNIRRQAGVWATALIVVHLYLLWKRFYHFSLDNATHGGRWFGYIECAILHAAFLYIVLMGLTSNDFFQKKLGSSWKKIHRGIYVLFPAIALAGAFEMRRIQSALPLVLFSLVSAFLIPCLQLYARKIHRLKRAPSGNSPENPAPCE